MARTPFGLTDFNRESLVAAMQGYVDETLDVGSTLKHSLPEWLGSDMAERQALIDADLKLIDAFKALVEGEEKTHSKKVRAQRKAAKLAQAARLAEAAKPPEG